MTKPTMRATEWVGLEGPKLYLKSWKHLRQGYLASFQRPGINAGSLPEGHVNPKIPLPWPGHGCY